jgi:hypothetical protein
MLVVLPGSRLIIDVILQNMTFSSDSMSLTEIPSWELNSGFNPMNVKIREQPAWITLEGKIPLPATHIPRAEEVIDKDLNFDVNFLPLRDPKSFLAGQIHSCVSEWESIIDEHVSDNVKILQWLKSLNFFKHTKEVLRGDITILVYPLSNFSRMLAFVNIIQTLSLGNLQTRSSVEQLDY